MPPNMGSFGALRLALGCACAAACVAPTLAEPASIESDSDGIVLRVKEGATVKVAFGNADPVEVVTQTKLDGIQETFDTRIKDLTTLLDQARRELVELEGDVKGISDDLKDDPDDNLQAEIGALSKTVGAFETCFKAGKMPGGKDGCALPDYTPCDDAKLSAPTNGMMAGTGVIPGTSRKFSCKDNFILKGVAEVHCKQDGTWEAAPTCTPAPVTKAPSTDKAWRYWRVANKGLTKHTPVVTEVGFFPNAFNNVCGGKRFRDFDGANKDSKHFLCSGSHAGPDRGCDQAHDFSVKTYQKDGKGLHGAWRPDCPDKNNCKPGEAWIGADFVKPVFVKCIWTLGINGSPSNSLGANTGTLPWNGGLKVEGSDDGQKWVTLSTIDCDKCNKNIAVVKDGRP